MINVRTISIAKDFSKFPAGRFREDGPYSGQQFREDLLAPALKQNSHVHVDLNGTMGYSSSFLEEAFGGLIRNGFTLDDLRNKLIIDSEECESLVLEVWSYIGYK